MDYLFILDEFLKVFKDPKQRAYNLVQLQNEFYKNNPSLQKILTRELIDEIIIKLLIDKFIREDERNSPNQYDASKGYLINIEGLQYIGYKKSFKISQTGNRIKRMKENLLILGTWLAGIGSILLVVWEIVKAIWIDKPCH